MLCLVKFIIPDTFVNNLLKLLIVIFLDNIRTIPNSIKYIKMSTAENPIECAIREALNDNLKPTHCEIINESYMHNVPKGSETHFKVLVVSDAFDNLPLIKVCLNFYIFLIKCFKKYFFLETSYD